MRRKDREITEHQQLLEIMQRCRVCHLALNDEDGFPYILPLNFGVEDHGGTIRLYFHSALEGHKLELMRRDPRASFEMDTGHDLQYFEERGYCTYAYESVIGKGRIRFLPEEEKPKALQCLMDHYHPVQQEKHAWFNPAAIPRTVVYCLEVTSLTGKRKAPVQK
ncbi:MAG: pyridoxamine 5'-phosphate oxidase family protein [Eubacteriales bacterium]|nr:pyridoxamine 5'-phosphate oxidase family protein [Eubacteriales bacterium]